MEATDGRGVDIAVDLTGNALAIQQTFQILRKAGRISLVGLPSNPVELDLVEGIIYKEARVSGRRGDGCGAPGGRWMSC